MPCIIVQSAMLCTATPKTPRVTVTGGVSARTDGVAECCIHGVCILPLPSFSLSLVLAGSIWLLPPPIFVLSIMQSQELCLNFFFFLRELVRDNGSTCGQQ